MRFRVLMIVALLLMVCGGVSQLRADFVINGHFADPNVGGGWGTFSSILGWTTGTSELIEIDNSLNAVGLNPYDADGQSLEVNEATFGIINQTINGLVTGASYDLSWAYGDRPGSGLQRLDVYFGGALVTTDHGTGAGGWTPQSYHVTATSSSEILSFVGVDVGGLPGYGNEIDAVSLNVPEPAASALLATMLMGLLATALRLRRS